VNACAREATAILLKVKPERYGPSPEVIPPLAAPGQGADGAVGYGILAEVQPVAAAAKAPRRSADPLLPPLRARPVAGGRTSDAAEADPQKRVLEDEPAPPRKQKKKGSSTDDDEDLLP
jgi:hypothetical protein